MELGNQEVNAVETKEDDILSVKEKHMEGDRNPTVNIKLEPHNDIVDNHDAKDLVKKELQSDLKVKVELVENAIIKKEINTMSIKEELKEQAWNLHQVEYPLFEEEMRADRLSSTNCAVVKVKKEPVEVAVKKELLAGDALEPVEEENTFYAEQARKYLKEEAKIKKEYIDPNRVQVKQELKEQMKEDLGESLQDQVAAERIGLKMMER